MMVWIWLGAVVLLAAVEAATVGLVCIWFAVGAAAALVAAVLHAALWLQILLFALVSAAALIATRPLVRRFTRTAAVPTNADRVLGQEARVTETVDNEAPSGAIYVDGKTWTARSADGTVLHEGDFARVERMEGVKLYVRPCVSAAEKNKEKTEAVK